jgi:flagellin
LKIKALDLINLPLKGGQLPVISTNNAANAALNYLNNNVNKSANSVQELASGSRIVQASSDAAGLAISEQLKSSLTNFQQDRVNVQQGASILAIADAGLAQISLVLARMMALASEAASGQVSDLQRRQDIDVEYQQLATEINSIASSAQYNGQSLLNYQNAKGAFSWQSSSVLLGFYEAQILRNTHYGANATQVSTPDLGVIKDTGQVATYTSGIYGLPAGATGSFNAGPLEALNNDPFGPTQFLTGNKASNSISVTIGAFNTVTLGLERDQVTYQDSAINNVTVSGSLGPVVESYAVYLAANPNAALAGQVTTTVNATVSNVATQSAAMLAIQALTSALDQVAQQRADFGAYESRFNFSQGVLDSAIQNTAAAVSTISDADVASVKAHLSAEDVATQAAIAATAQATQLPQELLRLIQS